MSEESPQMCSACVGLGAKVVHYPVKDEDGYEFMAIRNEPCSACQGKGYT